jgi:hypothetical protein
MKACREPAGLNYFDCFDPTEALSTKFFTLGLETLVLGLTFFGFPLDSFIALTSRVPGNPNRASPGK